jgi:poly-beta-1,6-N-acetyl-D-glucosamine N-deacetylase
MRRFFRQLIAEILILLGFVSRKNKYVHSQNLVTSIYFHNPSKELFKKCMNWLIENNYHFISTDDLYEILYKNKKVNNGAVCITVDDGKKDNLENIIPSAKELSIPVTIFVSTEPVETGTFWWSYVMKNNKINKENISVEYCKKVSNNQRLKIIDELKSKITLPREAMTKTDVARISGLEFITIGNHTMNHPITKRCELKELEHEISEASRVLKTWVSDEINYFAYPNGDFDEREVSILKENNIKLAFTTVPEHIHPYENINPYQIPRFSVNDEGSIAENICKMTGVWQTYIK